MDTYICMLTGSVEETEGHVKCSLCGMSNPSEKHLDAHNTQVCGPGIPGPYTCKRRADLVKHLKRRHNVQEKAQGEAVADKWKETTKKQSWSCGFCVRLFDTFGDRLRHIANHFECGQTLDEWGTTKVIEGLLLQPGMVNVWRKPQGWESSELTWKKDVVKNLQNDLELGPRDAMHAVALVKAVCDARQSGWHLFNDDFASVRSYKTLETNTPAPPSDPTSLTYCISQRSSNHDHSEFVNPAETVHNGVLAPGGDLIATNDYNSPPFSFPEEDCSLMGPWLSNSGQEWSLAADQYIG